MGDVIPELKIAPEDDEGVGSNLHFLGRRLERLFFGGLFIIFLCLIELSIASANKQAEEDHSAAGVILLLERLADRREVLEALFNTKPVQEKPPTPSIPAPSSRRERELAATRAKLGLPPAIPRADPTLDAKPAPPVETYADALAKLISEVSSETRTPPAELKQFDSPSVHPAEIIKLAESRKAEIESRPTFIWGIQTPRAFRVKYAEQELSIPYGILATVSIVPLGVLIVGWLAAVFMTRQREVILISQLNDYKMAFPHILNFLPVDFVSFSPKKRSEKEDRQTGAFLRVVQFIVRVLVVLLLSGPMLLGFSYAAVLILYVDSEPTSLLLMCAAALAFIMAMQILALTVQEWVALRGKHFRS